jgi:hypothetical protein
LPERPTSAQTNQKAYRDVKPSAVACQAWRAQLSSIHV